MKLREIFRFEFAYQIRRPWPWLAFAVLTVFAYENTRAGMIPVTLPQDFILNSPFIITTVTVFSCLIWLLVASAMAGDAAARDVQSGMHPLTYTMPATKAEYLGGRFLAAFALNALVLLGVQAGNLLGVYASNVSPEIIGPFRPAAYLAAYGFIALPNAFIATTIQFAFALLSGRALAAYFGSLMLVFFSVPVPLIVFAGLGEPGVAKLLDPIGMLAIMNEMMSQWTIVEKNVRMFTLEGPMLWNRLLWLGIALATNTIIYTRFQLAHRTAGDRGWLTRKRVSTIAASAYTDRRPAIPTIPRVRQSFGFATHLRQAISIARSSFRMTVKTVPGIFLLAVFPLLLLLVVITESQQFGVPMVPRTGYILAKHLTAPITFASDYRVMIPLLIIFFAGELVWRERDTRLSENIDATPVPDWVLLFGKFLGLTLILASYMVVLMLVGIAAQIIRGNHDFQIALYLKILFGFQLPEYMLFAALALVLQVAVNQKYVGLMATLVIYLLIVLSPLLGVHHNLLVYGASPNWNYTDMRGFGASVGPWLWFKLYWAAWAILLGIAARVLWVRGRESNLGARLRVATQRLSRATIATAVATTALIITFGGFIFYNTNVLNEYLTDDDVVQRRAEYERRFGMYEGIAQPQPVSRQLQIDIHPQQRTATVHGSYRMVNRSGKPIESVHIEPAFYAKTTLKFDRAAKAVVKDDVLGHSIYKLEEPLQPGDTLTMNFDVAFKREGFRNGGMRTSGAGTAILDNGTYFTNGALPVIGYQPRRELMSSADRRKYGLPRQVTLAPPGDVDPSITAVPPATFDAIISTDADQVAVAPGELKRSWIDGGRRYFHYKSDIPINGMDVFFSAKYKVHRERWHDVDLQIFLHPGHANHLDRVLRGVRASLDYNSAHFGKYPYRFLQVVEQPGDFLGMGVDGSGVITGGEGFFLLDPRGEGFDLMFEVVAHEMGHQWWGVQLKPAFAEGGGVISESLAWYSAMELVKKEKGREGLRRFMVMMREPSPWPPIHTGLPLLRAMDPWANYRKGPYAMHALSEYVGEDRVNGALRTLVAKKVSTLATTLDMYRELQAVTPDSLKPLLHDLFEVNTWWTFDTKKATAKQLSADKWQVTMEVEAKKVVADSAGKEKEVPIGEWVEIGAFAPAENGERLGKPLYVQKHRVRSGRQTITFVVTGKPARGGIDPYSLLDWEEGDNIEPIEVTASKR